MGKGIFVMIATMLLAVGPTHGTSGRESGDLVIMGWNCENFFDYIDSGAGESDAEFSSRGVKRWTKKRFLLKCHAVAKTILWTGDEMGRLPDIIALEEIENRRVLDRLLSETALRKLDYEVVHYDSPDHRGIDCALLYRSSALRLVDSKACHIYEEDSVMATRDIVVAQMVSNEDDSLAVLACHFPSKYGGEESDDKRVIVMKRMRFIADSLAAKGWRSQVALGDFNDEQSTLPISLATPALTPVRRSEATGQPPGSIRFNGKWELIDLVFASPALAGRIDFRVLQPPFLTERDATHGGEKPLRTYSGPRWLGGVSDHYPIVAVLKLE